MDLIPSLPFFLGIGVFLVITAALFMPTFHIPRLKYLGGMEYAHKDSESLSRGPLSSKKQAN